MSVGEMRPYTALELRFSPGKIKYTFSMTLVIAMNPSSIAPKVNRTSVENVGAIVHKTLITNGIRVSIDTTNCFRDPEFEQFAIKNLQINE